MPTRITVPKACKNYESLGGADLMVMDLLATPDRIDD
jgi:hypothetical protein